MPYTQRSSLGTQWMPQPIPIGNAARLSRLRVPLRLVHGWLSGNSRLKVASTSNNSSKSSGICSPRSSSRSRRMLGTGPFSSLNELSCGT